MRRAALVSLLLLTIVPVGPATADEPSPPDPMNRVESITPKPPGTRELVKLQYGPYVVHPGSDLSRVDFGFSTTDGFVLSARPAVRYADGTEPPDDVVHIHHAHWVRIKDPWNWPRNGSQDYNDYISWFFGTGEEKTRGGLDPVSMEDPRFNDGFRYGGPVYRGDKLAFISMLHNKTSRPLVVWLEGQFDFIHGTKQQLAALTPPLDFHPLTPVLHGATFQVPRTGGTYTWPRDLTGNAASWLGAGAPGGAIVPGVGHVWKAPFSGTIAIGAGHLHPGGRTVNVSNLGSQISPCGGAFLDDPDTDGFAGKTILRIRAYYQSDANGNEIFPSEGFQMGITQPAWRAKVRAGDIIAINGVYDTTNYAYPDAMSFFGFFTDESESPGAGEECSAGLIGKPVVEPADLESMMNRDWDEHTGSVCNPCDDLASAPPKGTRHLDAIHSAAFVYLPGDQNSSFEDGAPWVRRGEKVPVYNEDWALGLVRHSITSCAWPCNGPYSLNYPFHDGAFDSGALGYTPIDTYQVKHDVPMWTLDTASLEPGPYAYYCRLHPTMRGAFYVEPPA